MNVAVITGGSGGICSVLTKKIESENTLDEIWFISRKGVSSDLKNCKIVNILCDLSELDFSNIETLLRQRKPNIIWLVNGAGTGMAGAFEKIPTSESEKTVSVNCTALTCLCSVCLPYMARGAHIINLASASAFSPQPYFAVYAASKAYVLNFSLALSRECEERGIYVTAVCPGPVDTHFLINAQKFSPLNPKKRKCIYEPDFVASRAYKCAKKGKRVCTIGAKMKIARLACKLIPSSLVMKFFK